MGGLTDVFTSKDGGRGGKWEQTVGREGEPGYADGDVPGLRGDRREIR